VAGLVAALELDRRRHAAAEPVRPAPVRPEQAQDRLAVLLQ